MVWFIRKKEIQNLFVNYARNSLSRDDALKIYFVRLLINNLETIFNLQPDDLDSMDIQIAGILNFSEKEFIEVLNLISQDSIQKKTTELSKKLIDAFQVVRSLSRGEQSFYQEQVLLKGGQKFFQDEFGSNLYLTRITRKQLQVFCAEFSTITKDYLTTLGNRLQARKENLAMNLSDPDSRSSLTF